MVKIMARKQLVTDGVFELQPIGEIEQQINPELFRVLSRVASATEGWTQTTKAMEIPGVGCVLQVTIRFGDTVTNTLTLVPGERIVDTGSSFVLKAN